MKRHTSRTRPSRRHRTAEEIAGILKDYQGSGLSLLGFARKEGLCYATLLRWRSRQPKAAQPPVACALEPDPGFVPVEIQSEVCGDYVLSWPSGRSLTIPQHFERDSLRRVLRVLEAER